ncbi:hypothetical protein BGZ65_004165, partial [Modicella reniformis]
RAFSIDITKANTIGELKKAIKIMNENTFKDVDAKELTLWKVLVPITEVEEDPSIHLDNQTERRKFDPTARLSELFTEEPAKGTVHIIVEPPKDTEPPSDDMQFHNIIKHYQRTNTWRLVVALETPTKKYADYTLRGQQFIWRISTEPLNSDPHKESLRKLLDELDSDTTNEAACTVYVCSFLIFEGRALRDRNGHGKVDYSIEASAGGMTHILGVTKVKREDFKKAVAQNLVQLESSLTLRKRNRMDDDDEEEEEDKSIPIKAYGIVTDAVQCYFLECSMDQPDPGRPTFRISKLVEIINYRRTRGKAMPQENAQR